MLCTAPTLPLTNPGISPRLASKTISDVPLKETIFEDKSPPDIEIFLASTITVFAIMVLKFALPVLSRFTNVFGIESEDADVIVLYTSEPAISMLVFVLSPINNVLEEYE